MKRAFLFGGACAVALLTPSSLPSAQKPAKELRPVGRTVWDLAGGAFFATEGHIPNGPCFRIDGQVTAPDFFDKLKRVDDETGTKYLRGTEAVTEYPPTLDVSILLHDYPCSVKLKERTFELPLTKEEVGTLRLRLFWKHGVELRPAARYVDPVMHVRKLEPEIKPEANDLQDRYEWNLTFALPCEGVPIEDSLVFTFVAVDGTMAARTSARL